MMIIGIMILMKVMIHTDGDGIPDYLDLDSDGDGYAIVFTDADSDGIDGTGVNAIVMVIYCHRI